MMRRTPSTRRGSIALMALLVLPLLLLAGILVLSGARLRQIETELRAATDLSALAAATALADDGQLDPTGSSLPPLLVLADTAANTVWLENSVVGFTINQGTTPRARASLKLGHYDPTATPRFTSYDPTAPATRWNVNAAVVSGEFDGPNLVQAGSVAIIDRSVYGFAPLFGQNLPLMPIAIDEAAWTAQTPNLTDTVTVVVRFSTTPVSVGENASLLLVGGPTPPQLAQQVAEGITASQLVASGLPGGIILGAGNEVVVPGSRTLSAVNRVALEPALVAQAAKRVWPLTSTTLGGNVTVVGFVAARLVNVAVQTDGLGNDTALVLTLQPVVYSTPTAVTIRPAAASPVAANAYLGRVRLAE